MTPCLNTNLNIAFFWIVNAPNIKYSFWYHFVFANKSYYEILGEQEAAEAAKEQSEVPDVVGFSVGEAKKVLYEAGLKAELRGEGESVSRQLPPAGEVVNKDMAVILYTE